jgi:hypothetical protein
MAIEPGTGSAPASPVMTSITSKPGQQPAACRSLEHGRHLSLRCAFSLLGLSLKAGQRAAEGELALNVAARRGTVAWYVEVG